MLFLSQFTITKTNLQLLHDGMERAFFNILNTKEYLVESELLTVISTILGMKQLQITDTDSANNVSFLDQMSMFVLLF